jgi:hypothetical protein
LAAEVGSGKKKKKLFGSNDMTRERIIWIHEDVLNMFHSVYTASCQQKGEH